MTAQSGLGFSGIVAIQIPDDGAAGEVLTKLTGDNYDYDWLPGGGGGAPTNAEYVVMSLDATLTDERVLTAGTGISIVDGGAGGNVTISLDGTGITLQDAYDNSGVTQPKIEVTAAGGPVSIRDAVVPIASLFDIQTNAGVEFFEVDASTMAYGITGNRGYEFALDPTGRESIRFLPDGRTQTTAAVNVYAVQWDSFVIANVPGGLPFGNDTAPAMIGAVGECRFDDPGNLFSSSLLFNQGSVLSLNGVNIGPVYTMVNQPQVRNVAAGSRTVSQANAVRSQMRVGPNTAGNITLTSHVPFFITASVDATVGTASITTMYGIQWNSPTLTAGGTIGTYIGMRIEAVTGPTTIRGIQSVLNSGILIEQLGTAPIQIAGGGIHLNDGIPLQFGGTAFNSQDFSLLWNAAGYVQFFFASTSDSMELSSPDADRFLFDSNAADNEITFNFARFQFGGSGTVGNQIGLFTAPATTVTIAGGFAQYLLTQAGNLNLGVLAMSDVSAWVVNAPSFDNTAYSITELATFKVGGMTTSNPGGTVTERAAFWNTGRFLQRGSIQTVPISPAALAAGNNNDWAGLLTGSPNNNTRFWARISGNAVTSVITGIDATAVQDGDTFELTNVSANAIDMTDQDVASVAANRLITPTGVTYTIAADETVIIRYDSTTARWRLLAGTGA